MPQLPVELREIFKHKQKSYKMALIQCLTAEGVSGLHNGVQIDQLAQWFRSHYLEREQAGLPCEVPPTHLGNTWSGLTVAQIKTIMQNPIQALIDIFNSNVDRIISFKQDILNQMDDQQLSELRDYAKREEEAYYASLSASTIPLRNHLLQVMNSYHQARNESIKEHPIDQLVRKIIPAELRKLSYTHIPLIVQGSVGKGNWAAIPWIAIMNERITMTTQKGEYLVYLFSEDMSAVYLTFMLGVTEPMKKKGKKAAFEYLRTKAAEIREIVPLEGAHKDKEIYLTASGLGEAYQESTIAYYKYTKDDMPSDEQLLADLKSMVDDYNLYAEKRQVAAAAEQTNQPVFRFTMSYLHYVQGVVSYLADDTDHPVSMNELLNPSIQPRLFKSGDAIKHPEDRLRSFIRVLVELGIVEHDDHGFSLKELGQQYALYIRLDNPWTITDEQAALLRNVIEDPSTTNELPRVIRLAAEIAERKHIFTHEDFQPEFIEAMGVAHFEEVTQQSRTKFMLNWLEELQYIRKQADSTYIYVEESDEVSTTMTDHLTVQERVNQIKFFIANQGFSYPGSLIENFYLSLKTKPFVILAGISGTGKTKLVKLFAEALGATERNGQFTLIPVRPDWSDPSDLIGYQDLAGQFRPGPLTKVLIEAMQPANRNKPYFICLDEMNLARVEHYFSDMLSILETQRRDGGRIVTDRIVSKELLQTMQTTSNEAAQSPINNDLIIPDNVFLIGTVNMDETTHPFSKKVLDRANTLEFNYIRLDDFPMEQSSPIQPSVEPVPASFLQSDYLTLQNAFSEHQQLIRTTTEELVKINAILEELHAHVGFRVRDAVCFFMIYNERFGLLEPSSAFDTQLLQKILPRIQGSSQSVKRVLIRLLQYCTGAKGSMDNLLMDASDLYKPWRSYDATPEARYPQSARKLAYMLRRLEEDGFTSFWLS
ncbi:MrcB family domain-containing protein [Paenibacillus kobensis]|uniref:MrcB family domain-containing protein n=1 Tax=Paenibacillus kobensis TaxID=59841 RepID=UPI000FD72FF1|nr:DUF3578 domain-containing protein [Paenibacillus kobensis]